MTPKERVLTFYKHKIPDELPTDDGVHIIYDANGYHERPPFIKSGKDWFGVDWIYEDSIGALAPDPYQEPILEDICDWREKVVFPDLEKWDWSQAENSDNLKSINRDEKVLILMLLNGPFERLHLLLGFENALCALLTDPEEVKDFFEEFTKWKCLLIEKIKEYYNPDVLMFHDDWGTQNNMFFSPEVWRELIKPYMKTMIEKTHELGMIFELHSCGFIEPIVPEFVEIGIDSWQGQEINNIPKLKELTNNKLAFHTTPRYQTFESESLGGTLTEEKVREIIRKEVTENSKGGNYMPMPLPWGGWWLPVMIDEIKKISKTIYS